MDKVKKEVKTQIISDVSVSYTERFGLADTRYEMSFMVNNSWRSHTLVCSEDTRYTRMKEIVDMYKNIDRR